MGEVEVAYPRSSMILNNRTCIFIISYMSALHAGQTLISQGHFWTLGTTQWFLKLVNLFLVRGLLIALTLDLTFCTEMMTKLMSNDSSPDSHP